MDYAICPKCNGKGDFEGGGNRWNYCYDCHGTGKIKAAQHRMHLTAFGAGMRRFIARKLIKLAYWLAPFGGK